MVDSWNCLDQVVPEGMSQVSRRSEVGNHKQRSLNTRLSFGTFAGTFASPAGPYRKGWGEAGTKNEHWHVFGTSSKKGLENQSSRFKPKISWISFSRGSGPPLNDQFHMYVARYLCGEKEKNQRQVCDEDFPGKNTFLPRVSVFSVKKERKKERKKSP